MTLASVRGRARAKPRQPACAAMPGYRHAPLLTRPLRAARARACPCVGATLGTNERGRATICGHLKGACALGAGTLSGPPQTGCWH
eukprot:5389484-Alexandrium_andersonii.AAC.1